MRSQFLKLTAIIAAVLLTSGCGGSSSSGSGNNNNGGQSTTADWQNLKMDGAVAEGKYAGRKLITLDKANKMLVVHLPTLALPVIIGGGVGKTITTPQLPGASLALQLAADGNLDLVLNIPLEHVMHGASFMDPQKLPNGDALPAIPDGELPGLALDLNSNKSVKGYIYLAPATFGALVTSQFDPTISMQLPIYQNNGAVLGYLTTVPAKNGFDGGIFMSVKVPADIARIIDDVI